MTCKHALTLARRGDRAAVAPHLATCPACTAQLAAEDSALTVARQHLAVTVPSAQVDRIVAAALAAGTPLPAPWWDLALPIAWRAAAALNVAAVVALAYLAIRPPAPPSATRLPTPIDVEDLLTHEADAMLVRALGLEEVAP